MPEAKQQACENCGFWDNSTQAQSAQPDTTGLCRKLPPVADERDGTARWPFTEDTDWCGAFEASIPDDLPYY